MMSPRPPSLVKPLSVSPALSRMLGSCASPRTPVEMPRANGDLGGCAIPGSAGLFEGCCSPGVLGCDLDVEIYDDIPEKSCPVRILAHGFATASTSACSFSWRVLSDLEPSGIGGYQACADVVGACADSCRLRSRM